MLNGNHSQLVRIDAHGKTTEQLLGAILIAFNAGNRATFLCERGKGADRIQQIRMRLSRQRTKMDVKGIPKQHFRLEARMYPYTNQKGTRMDCVVMEKKVTQIHSIAESLEGILKNADTSGNGSNGQGARTAGFEW